ncbi:MAG TPA: nuclear transport factor 2 family protein [Acidimicrobiales bacterium]|nr:nuclear transport factor 2 family protein [Acidimicrobiales bacterium]
MADDSTVLGNLIARYAELIDSGDFAGVADLLGNAGVGDGTSSSLLRGRDALAAMFTATTRRYSDGTPRTKHMTTNLILEIDGDAGRASARSYWMVLQAVEGLPLQPILAGRYHDRFERAEGAWRFAERRYFIDLVGDVSRHVLKPLPT